MNADQNQSVVRDERTVAVENASYKWAYTLVLFALLFDAWYRGFFRNEAAWDLLAMVIISGTVRTAYQVRQDTLQRGWGRMAFLIACIAGIIAFAAALVASLAQ